MKLSDLNPRLEGTVEKGELTYNCPLGYPHTHSVSISSSGEKTDYGPMWKATGDFPSTLTLTPSILSHYGVPTDESLSDGNHSEEYQVASKCGWHGFIRNGEMVNA